MSDPVALEAKYLECRRHLQDLIVQADEDTPASCRTTHFNETITSAIEFLECNP